LCAVETQAGWIHDWDTMIQQSWIDFAGAGYQLVPTADQLKFVANNNAIVSLEKCFAMANYSTNEEAVYKVGERR
jgi:hypothetical protein